VNKRSVLMKLCVIVVTSVSTVAPALAVDVTCWFPPKFPAESAKRITDALGAKVPVHARIAQSYPEILEAFSGKGDNVAYVGSFVQAILSVKQQGVTLVQAVDGKEFYGAWMIYPKGGNPTAILSQSPTEIAFAKGASSGESGAKAATEGKATIATSSHDGTAAAVKSGKAKAGFVKSWWWEANKAKYPEFDVYRIPGVSDAKNPDNVLTASRSLDAGLRNKLKAAALASAASFGAKSVVEFNGDLSFSVSLMRKGKIDPAAYMFE